MSKIIFRVNSLDIDDGEEGVFDLLNDGVIVGSELGGWALGILFVC